MIEYLGDPDAIYAESFATIRREADFSAVPDHARGLVERLIHACGMIDITADLVVHGRPALAGVSALRGGKPIVTDCAMVAAGITRRFLPEGTVVLNALEADAEAIASIRAERPGRCTRSAAAMRAMAHHLDGAIVAVGNAPTALFELIEMIDTGVCRPAVILAFPVGFVGAAEAKAYLAATTTGQNRRPDWPDFITLLGRRGGSAMASAAVNAIALEALR